jgi:hypothetical protein
MSKMIRIKRGLDSARANYTPGLGELVWSIDTHELWIGDGNTLGGIKITEKVEELFILKSEKGAAGGVATIGVDGKIPSEQLPQLALTETFVVDSEAEMVNLPAQMGDVAIRTDINKSFIKSSTNTGTAADWVELLSPPNAVLSVNGKVGNVTLALSDLSDIDLAGILDGYLINWNASQGKWEVVSPDDIGRTTFTALDDTPADYINSDGYILKVDETNNKIIFTDVIDGGQYTGHNLRTANSSGNGTPPSNRRVATPRTTRRPRPR